MVCKYVYIYSVYVCTCQFILKKMISLSDPGRGDDDESVGRGDVDEGRVMEQDLVEGSVATAAADALASAATKAKVKTFERTNRSAVT